jgi:hypothetical protein
VEKDVLNICIFGVNLGNGHELTIYGQQPSAGSRCITQYEHFLTLIVVLPRILISSKLLLPTNALFIKT